MNRIKAIIPVFIFFAICFRTVCSAQGVSFSCGWENGITGNGNWKNTQVVAADRFQRVTNPVRYGQYAVRVEVRPGDDPINSSGERSEVYTMLDANGNGIYESESSGTQWFAWSSMIGTGWQTPSEWALLFQLHGPDAYHASPSVGITCKDSYGLNITAGDLHGGNPTDGRHRIFSDGDLNEGTWVDFLMKIKFARDSSGSITVYRRNEGQTEFLKVYSAITPTLQYNDNTVMNHYWKHGLYRGESSMTNVLYLDCMTRGTDSAAVLSTAFGAVVSIDSQSYRIYTPDSHGNSLPRKLLAGSAGDVIGFSINGRKLWASDCPDAISRSASSFTIIHSEDHGTAGGYINLGQ